MEQAARLLCVSDSVENGDGMDIDLFRESDTDNGIGMDIRTRLRIHIECVQYMLLTSLCL